MSVEDVFTAEEWQLLLHLPMKIGLSLITMSPSGPIGLTKETMALAKAPFQLAQADNASGLVSALALKLQNQAKPILKEEQSALKQAQPYGYKGQTVTACQNAAAALAKADPADATAYRQWVLAVGQQVAEAAKDSGVLVSDVEKTLLQEFSQALGADAQTPEA
jgi:hypothetical protein